MECVTLRHTVKLSACALHFLSSGIGCAVVGQLLQKDHSLTNVQFSFMDAI